MRRIDRRHRDFSRPCTGNRGQQKFSVFFDAGPFRRCNILGAIGGVDSVETTVLEARGDSSGYNWERCGELTSMFLNLQILEREDVRYC